MNWSRFSEAFNKHYPYLRILPECLALLGLFVFLSTSGISWRMVVAWSLVAGAILLAMGLAWRVPYEKTWLRMRKWDAGAESEHLWKNAQHSLIAIGLLLASAFGFMFVAPGKRATGSEHNGTSIYLSGGYANMLPPAPNGGGPIVDGGEGNEKTLHLRFDNLEDALSNFLKRPPEKSGGVSGWMLLAIAVIAFFAGLITKRPAAAAPVAGAGVLAEEMVRHLDHLTNVAWAPPTGLKWIIPGSLFLLAGVLLVWGARKIGHEKHKEKEATEPAADERNGFWEFIKRCFCSKSEGSGAETLLSVGFSVLLVAFVMGIVPVDGTKKDGSCPTCPTCGERTAPQFKAGVVLDLAKKSTAESESKATLPLLRPVHFAPMNSKAPEIKDSQEVENLKGALRKVPFQEGDMLVLLGSADCTPMKKQAGRDNKALALQRATKVKDLIQDLGLNTWTIALDQHDGCKGQPDIREVFPYLIRAEAGKAHQ